MTYKTDCVFCTRLMYREFDFHNDHVASFEPLNPVTPGHRLFVPFQHVTDASEDFEITGRTFSFAARYAHQQGGDFNLITSKGPEATQSIPHLHVHYVPRHSGDNLHLPWTHQHSRENWPRNAEQTP